MPHPFAAGRLRRLRELASAVSEACPPLAANDNLPEPEEASVAANAGPDPIFAASLRWFAEHGLGAAREASLEAERAALAREWARYEWWLGICRTLDRRMAASLERLMADGGEHLEGRTALDRPEAS